MYIDMEQINNFSATSGQAGAKSAGEGSNALPPTSHHSRSLSVDALAGFNSNRPGLGGNYSSDAPRRPRHQHSSSMDGSTSFKHDMLVSDFEGSDGKKAMASAKLSEIALIDPKRAKRSDCYLIPSIHSLAKLGIFFGLIFSKFLPCM
jgi:hypothetical protein